MTGEEPATERQRQWIRDLGVVPERIPPEMTRAQASRWIEELREYKESAVRGTIPSSRIRSDLLEAPPAVQVPRPATMEDLHRPGPVPPGTTVTATTEVGGKSVTATTPVSGSPTTEPPGFRTAREVRDQAGAAPTGQPPEPARSAIEVYEEREEDRGPLTPVQVMTKEEREGYGLGETETVVVRGTKQSIVPEYGMPAKYLYARLSRNVQTNRVDVRVFASIEGLTFRANAYSEGIRKLQFEYVAPESVPGMAQFMEETKDPQVIARAHVVLGNGTEITEEGTVRLSEIQLRPSRRDPRRMVARSPVARTNYLEVAKKRALARALRWGTGFGGTALDELPTSEQEILPGTKARALPAAKDDRK